jgi:hypothetical protein
MKCIKCQQEKELNILNYCNECFKVDECFYYEDILKLKDKAKEERLKDLSEVAAMLKECDMPRYVENQSFSNRINDIIEQLKELDLIKENTNL